MLSCNEAFCLGKKLARAAVEGAAYDYAADFVQENCMPAISEGIDRIQEGRAKAQRDMFEMRDDAIAREDYAGAALIYEASDMGPGDGCVIA